MLELPGFRAESAGRPSPNPQFLDDAKNVAVLLDEGLGQVSGTVAAGKSFASTYPLVSGGI